MKRTPKYKIIESYIVDNIKDGTLKVGDQIETEVQLSEKFNIGRLTVNKALINLAREGYIQRTAGRGSFVLSTLVSKSLGKGSSFSEDMASLGLQPGSQLIEYKIISAREVPAIAETMELKPNELIHYFVRLRTANDLPIAVSYTYLSSRDVPAVNVQVLENGSFTEYLKSVGVHTSGSIYRLSAKMPNDQLKGLLNIDSKTPVLLNINTSFGQDRKPFEYSETYYVCDQYEFSFRSGFTNV